MSSWMLTRLTRATRDQDGAADADRMALLTSPVTRTSYLDFLERIYGFEAPLERAFAMTDALADAVDLRSRMHIRLLRSDLAALGVDASELAVCDRVTAFQSCSEALGWMYVVDRNAQLHGNVHRHLQQSLPRQLGGATSYLAGGGVAAAFRLHDLDKALTRVTQSAELADQIVESALAAFACQRDWFHQLACPARVLAA
jgi:heme oxygenase